MKICMAVLSLIGITGIYLRQVKQTGVLGLIGYVVLGARLPRHLEHPSHRCVRPPRPLLPAQPGYVNDVLGVAASGAPVGDIGAIQPLIQLGGFTYIVGGIIFGIALFRAGILARWAAALLAVGGVATVATSCWLPEIIQRLFAIPVSVALIGLGYSLWREQRTQTAQPLASPASPQLDPAGAR